MLRLMTPGVIPRYKLLYCPNGYIFQLYLNRFQILKILPLFHLEKVNQTIKRTALYVQLFFITSLKGIPVTFQIFRTRHRYIAPIFCVASSITAMLGP